MSLRVCLKQKLHTLMQARSISTWKINFLIFVKSSGEPESQDLFYGRSIAESVPKAIATRRCAIIISNG